MRIETGKYVTVFSDASFCPDTRTFGFAFWIKYGRPAVTVRASGGGYDMANSTEAEYQGILFALAFIEENGIPIAGKTVVVQCDCLAALGRLREAQPLPSADLVKVKHVRGHNGYRNARSAVNTWCDKRAYAEMAKRREKISKGTLPTE